MVNLNKWEEIQFEDVREGDIIKVVGWSDTEAFKTKSVSESKIGVHSRWGGGFAAGTLSILPAPAQKAAEFKRTIYRRKAKPFEFPTNVGAIIEGELKHLSGKPNRYVRMGHGWRSLETGCIAYEASLSGNFTNWKILSEGLTE